MFDVLLTVHMYVFLDVLSIVEYLMNLGSTHTVLSMVSTESQHCYVRVSASTVRGMGQWTPTVTISTIVPAGLYHLYFNWAPYRKLIATNSCSVYVCPVLCCVSDCAHLFLMHHSHATIGVKDNASLPTIHLELLNWYHFAFLTYSSHKGSAVWPWSSSHLWWLSFHLCSLSLLYCETLTRICIRDVSCVCILVMSELEIGVIIGVSIGFVCIVVCIMVLILKNR